MLLPICMLVDQTKISYLNKANGGSLTPCICLLKENKNVKTSLLSEEELYIPNQC